MRADSIICAYFQRIYAELGLNSRSFATPTLSSRDQPKRFVKESTQGADPNPSEVDSDIEPEEMLYPMTIKFRKLKKESVEQVCILTCSFNHDPSLSLPERAA